LSLLIVLTVALTAASFSLVASFVLWRARRRSALWNMVAASIAVIVATLVLLMVIVVLMRRAFGPSV